MYFNIGIYRASKQTVIDFYQNKGIDYIAFVCSVSGIPVIAAYYFILEDFPLDEDAKRKLQAALEFYDYEGVIP